MKYLIKTNCLERYNIGYIVEADSEEEAVELLLSERDGDIFYNYYDCTDQIDIKSVEPYEN